MEAKDRIYIARVRGRLPRRYEADRVLTSRQKWRWFALFCLLNALFWGGIYLVAKR